jgi:hypothetical protein
MIDPERELNDVADCIAAEGMTYRASKVRAGAAEIARQRHEIQQLQSELRLRASIGMVARPEGCTRGSAEPPCGIADKSGWSCCGGIREAVSAERI